ncbi:hypothetical protein BJ742DRAFT_858887 [Cladochytrium replicatum]|nr:hypothetical protein BJ742DRAFT_858887 [Cladochytrium replicatum]
MSKLPWVDTVAIGRSSYYIEFTNGRLAWSDLCDELEDAIDDDDEHDGAADQFKVSMACAQWVSIHDLRYTHNTISDMFWDRSQSIYYLRSELEDDERVLHDVPYIRAWKDEDGVWWSEDDRRLWAFKSAGSQSSTGPAEMDEELRTFG